jgi:signal transduction histidine kinase
MAEASPTNNPSTKIELIYKICRITARTVDWRRALDDIAHLIRPFFIFDNLVVYTLDPKTRSLDVHYARALGRGRSAEADSSWGNTLASEVLAGEKTSIQRPTSADNNENDRLKKPYLLGIPLRVARRFLGTIIFVRFGGPDFTKSAIEFAEHLADQISQLMERQNLSLKYKELETLSQELAIQDDFISTITHELRTPLGFIKGYATTLLRSDTTWDQPAQAEFLNIIDQETDHLQELIDNLLDSARLQSGQLPMTIQAVRVDGLINDTRQRVLLHQPNLQIQIITSGKIQPIQGDPHRLTQVFENLFSNSEKYAHESPVLITIKSAPNGVLIDFEDQGPGILPQHLKHIFERFYRVPGSPSSIHGTGLGLFICMKIIQAHHGTIGVESRLQEGTKFHIFLPQNPEAADSEER